MLGSRESQWSSAKSVHREGEVGDRQTVEGTEGSRSFRTSSFRTAPMDSDGDARVQSRPRAVSRACSDEDTRQLRPRCSSFAVAVPHPGSCAIRNGCRPSFGFCPGAQPSRSSWSWRSPNLNRCCILAWPLPKRRDGHHKKPLFPGDHAPSRRGNCAKM
jgi:hypothetical protein